MGIFEYLENGEKQPHLRGGKSGYGSLVRFKSRGGRLDRTFGNLRRSIRLRWGVSPECPKTTGRETGCVPGRAKLTT